MSAMNKTAHIKLTLALPLLLVITGCSLFGWYMLTDSLWHNYTQKASQKLQTDAQIAYNNAVVDFIDEYAGAYRLTPFMYFLEGTTQIAPIFCVVDTGSSSDKTQTRLDSANSSIWGGDFLWTADWLDGNLQIRDQIRAVLTEDGMDGTLTLERVYNDTERLSRILDMPPKIKNEVFRCNFAPLDWSVPRKK